MTDSSRASGIVLALHPTTWGFGWAAFRGPLSPVDWNAARVLGDRNAQSLKRIRRLIDRFRPSEIIIEQFEGEPTRRHPRVRRLYRSIVKLAQENGIEPRIFTREAIETVFATFNAKTRYDIAKVIASKIDSFGHLLPPERKPWLPEHPRMGLFSAAALAITYFALIDGRLFHK